MSLTLLTSLGQHRHKLPHQLACAIALALAGAAAGATSVQPSADYSFSSKYANADGVLGAMVETTAGQLLLSTTQTLYLRCGQLLAYSIATGSVSPVTLSSASVGCLPSSLVKDASGVAWGVAGSKGSGKRGSLFRVSGVGPAQAAYSYTKADSRSGMLNPPAPALMADGSLRVMQGFPAAYIDNVLWRHAAPAYLPQLVYAFQNSTLTSNPYDMQGLADGSLLALGLDRINSGSLLMRIDAGGNLSVLTGLIGYGVGTGMADGGDGYYYISVNSGTGGAPHAGRVLRTDTAGNVALLYTFAGGSDGRAPLRPPVPGGDGWLYGATAAGGNFDKGTLYRLRVTASGTEYEKLFDFGGGGKLGEAPGSQLMRASDGRIYGRTRLGGRNGTGAIFSFQRP